MLHLTVAQDGSGDYASVSEAVLAVPYELEAEIVIGPGIYREKLVCEKRCITCGVPVPTRPSSSGPTAASCPTRMAAHPHLPQLHGLLQRGEPHRGGPDHRHDAGQAVWWGRPSQPMWTAHGPCSAG